MNILFDPVIKAACPDLKIGVIRCNITNTPTTDELVAELQAECNEIASRYELLEINKRPAVAATRALYKALGKDPNRYRVSSEALCRRAVKGMDLYHINAVVDLINLASMHSGYSIGAFDADKFVGDTLLFRPGTADDRYEGIGRGVLNITGLPVYFDAVGGIGSPTSDEERTKITLETTHLHVNVNCFAEEIPLDTTLEYIKALLVKYANAQNIEQKIFL